MLNHPFYIGSSLGPAFSRRLEHDRLSVFRRPTAQNQESFYIAINSEPQRGSWDASLGAANDRLVRIPLWTSWLMCLGWTAWAWHPR